jgi:hypothetical protein
MVYVYFHEKGKKRLTPRGHSAKNLNIPEIPHPKPTQQSLGQQVLGKCRCERHPAKTTLGVGWDQPRKETAVMKHVLSLLMLIFVFCSPASAEIKGCYERRYDAGVLKRHPGQVVTAVVLAYGILPNDQEDFEDFLSFDVRGSKVSKLSHYTCTGSASRLACKLENFGDGSQGGRGSFILTETKDGVTLSPSTDLSLIGRSGEKPYKLKVKSNPDHKVFTLRKTNVDLESCGASQ